METVTHIAERHIPTVPAATPPDAGPAPTLAVTASYLLSEDGRKASLLSGGDGRALQQLTLQVPAHRLHLVSVDKQGVARLKLRPRFERDGNERVVRIDAAPLYDRPPSIEDLYRAAAQNHELERVYHTARTTGRLQRHEADRDRRTRLAEAFLGDPAQRAVPHPPPSAKRCHLVTDQGRVRFDVTADQGRAKDVPPEAHRRFRADLRARETHNREQRTAQLAVHEQKKQRIAEWVAAHGTDEQKHRQAVGMLPIQEAIEAMTDQAFAAIGDREVYARDGADRLQASLRQRAAYAEAVVALDEVVITSAHAVKATQAQWAFVQAIQAAKPDASVTLRVHKLTWKDHPEAPALVLFGVLVTCAFGPMMLRREYLAPDA